MTVEKRFPADHAYIPARPIHQLIAPHAWRLPFERAWRDPNPTGV